MNSRNCWAAAGSSKVGEIEIVAGQHDQVGLQGIDLPHDLRLPKAGALDVGIGQVHQPDRRQGRVQLFVLERDLGRLHPERLHHVSVHLHQAEAQVEKEKQQDRRADTPHATSPRAARGPLLPAGEQDGARQGCKHPRTHQEACRQRQANTWREGKLQMRQNPQQQPVGQAE